MTETLTEKQRVAVEALEGAQRAGVPLSDYAKAKGPVYDAIAALRRRGALPASARPRKRQSRFVAVRVRSSPVAAALERQTVIGLYRTARRRPTHPVAHRGKGPS